ncbi:MAG TPA: DUF5667 domain-containing protein [Egibacteraceae bacterium]|nr:DUF5667 domain-containing protein [Egibacteraceae bacterium]
MPLRWIISAYVAVSVLATLAYVFGASIGYRKGWLEGRRVPDRVEGPLRLCLPSREPKARRSHRARHVLRGHTIRSAAPLRTPHHDAPPSGIRALRPVTSALVALVVVALAVPATAATASALPGQPLWSAKLGLERVQLVMARDDGAKARLRVEFAERRVSELAAVAKDELDAETVALISVVVDEHTREAAEEVARLPAGDAAAAALGARTEAASHQQVELLAALSLSACPDKGPCPSAGEAPPGAVPASAASAGDAHAQGRVTEPYPLPSLSGGSDGAQAPASSSESSGSRPEPTEDREHEARRPTASAPASSEPPEQATAPKQPAGDQPASETDRPRSSGELSPSGAPQTTAESGTPAEAPTATLTAPPPSVPGAPELDESGTEDSNDERAPARDEHYGRRGFQDNAAQRDPRSGWPRADRCDHPSGGAEQGVEGPLPESVGEEAGEAGADSGVDQPAALGELGQAPDEPGEDFEEDPAPAEGTRLDTPELGDVVESGQLAVENPPCDEAGGVHDADAEEPVIETSGV